MARNMVGFRRQPRVRRLGLAVFLMAILAGCTTPNERDIFVALDAKGFIRDQAEIVSAADWKDAIVIEIDIRQNEFDPPLIHLFQGEPYIIVVENRDDVKHMLASPEFFKTAAIRKLITETEEISGANLVGINLDPGEVKEVHLVPVRDGWYHFEGAHGGPAIFLTDRFFAPFSHGARRGMVGAFIVNQ